MKLKCLTIFTFILFSLLSNDYDFEKQFNSLINDKLEKIKDHKNILEKVYIEQLVFKKSDALKDKDLIFEIYDRMKEVYGNEEITYIYLQIDKEDFSYKKYFLILIEIIERVQKLDKNIESYEPKGVYLPVFKYKKDILNIDFKADLLNEKENINGDTFDFVFFVNQSLNTEFKKTLYNFYSMFHALVQNEKYSLKINFILSDDTGDKNKQFFNYPDYFKIYKKFYMNFIFGCGSFDHYDIENYTNMNFPYMLLPEYNEIELNDKHTNIKKYMMVRYVEEYDYKFEFLSFKALIFNINYTRDIDLDSKEYLHSEQNDKNYGYKPIITDLLVNTINISAHKCEDGPCLQNKIYFKQINFEFENKNKTICLVKKFESDKASIRDYFIEQIKNLENIYNTKTKKIDMELQQKVNDPVLNNKSNDIHSLSPCFLYNNLESIFTRIYYNVGFLRYNFCHRNIFFFHGHHTTLFLKYDIDIKRLSSIPYELLMEYLREQIPNIEQMNKFSFAFDKKFRLSEFKSNFDTNLGNENISELYFNEKVDDLYLNEGIHIGINVNETVQDLYVFFMVYIPNKDSLARQFYNQITNIDEEILNKQNKFLLFKYKEILCYGINNFTKYVETFVRLLEQNFSISIKNTMNCSKTSYRNLSNIKVTKYQMLSLLFFNPLNDLAEMFYHVLFTNMIFKPRVDDIACGLSLVDFLHTLRKINCDINFLKTCNIYYLDCLTNIKDMIFNYKIIPKISDFFTKFGLEKIVELWESFHEKTILKLSEIFILENKTFFDNIKEKEKLVIMNFIRELFIEIVKNIKYNVDISNNTQIEVGFWVFEKEVYIDGLDLELCYEIDKFFRDNLLVMCEIYQ